MLGRDPGYDRYINNFYKPMEVTYLANSKVIMLIEFPRLDDNDDVPESAPVLNSEEAPEQNDSRDDAISPMSDVLREDKMSKADMFAKYQFIIREIDKTDFASAVIMFMVIYANIRFISRAFGSYTSGNGSAYLVSGILLCLLEVACIYIFVRIIKKRRNYNKIAREDIEKNRLKKIYLTPSDFVCHEAWLDKLLHRECRTFTLRLTDKRKLLGRDRELDSYFSKFNRPIEVTYLKKSGIIMTIK